MLVCKKISAFSHLKYKLNLALLLSGHVSGLEFIAFIILWTLDLKS